MTTGVTCTVLVDGVRAADGSPGDDLSGPVILDDLAVTWGRGDTMSQPDAETCTFEVMDQVGGESFIDQYTTGRRVDVIARGLTNAEPSLPTFANGGFETAEVTWSASGGTAARTSSRVHGGASALRLAPSVAGQPATLLLAPGVLQPAGTNPDAWDEIPTTSAAERWHATVSVWLPLGASVAVRGALFTGPYATAAVPTGVTRTVVGARAWVTLDVDLDVLVADRWLGLQLVLDPTGQAWNELAPALAWDGLDPTLSWDDLGTLVVDDAQVMTAATAAGRGVLVFSGRITDTAASWDSSTSSPVVKVTAVGFTADLQNRLVGDEPWTVEDVELRAHRIVELAGLPISIGIDESIASTLLSYRDVDRQGATGLLQEIATSVDGVLWPAVHQSIGAYLRLEDPANRTSLLQLVDVAGPAPVVLRRNLATNPRATTIGVAAGALAWATRWFGQAPATGTSVVVTAATDGPAGVSSYIRKTWTVAPTGGQTSDVGFQHTNAYGTGTASTGRAVTAGTTYTLTSYLRSSRAQAAADVGWSLRLLWHDAAGLYLSSSTAPGVALPAGAWTRLVLSATAPARAAFVDVISSVFSPMTGIVAGDTLDGTALLMEAAAAVGTYFDGSTPDAPTADHAWTGAANASPSTLSSVQTHEITIEPTDPDEGFDLSACLVLRDPVTWVRDVTDVVTRVSVGWRVQGLDDEGQPTTTDAAELVVDAELEALYGTRAASISTQLQAADDAHDVADRVMQRSSPDGWRASGLTIDDDDVASSAAGIDLVLGLLDGTSRIGAPIVLGDLPSWTPAGAQVGVYLEGGTYRYVSGRWVLDLGVSASTGLGSSAAWDELDPAWSWDQWSPDITWDDLRGVAAP